jgi:hypothetical protein
VSPVSAIEMERSLKERSRANAATKTTTTKIAKGQCRVPKIGTDGLPAATGGKPPHPARVKEAAVREAQGKPPRKVATKMVGPQRNVRPKKAAAKKTTNGSGPRARLTTEWLSKKGNEVMPKDTVKLANGLVGQVLGRWTLKKEGRTIPFLTIDITGGGPADGDFAVSTKTGSPRVTSAAADVTHTK